MSFARDYVLSKFFGKGSGGGGDVLASIINDTIEGEYYNDKATGGISDRLFSGCNLLTKVNFPNVAGGTGEYAFNGCAMLTEAYFPNAEQVLNFCFLDCGNLKKVVASKAFRLVNYCFKGCTSLEIVDCAATVAINSMNFATTTNLKHLVLRADQICGLESVACLSATKIASGEGYVYVHRKWLSDTDAKKDYRQATNWATYATQFRVLEDYTVDGTVTGELDESKI